MTNIHVTHTTAKLKQSAEGKAHFVQGKVDSYHNHVTYAGDVHPGARLHLTNTQYRFGLQAFAEKLAEGYTLDVELTGMARGIPRVIAGVVGFGAILKKPEALQTEELKVVRKQAEAEYTAYVDEHNAAVDAAIAQYEADLAAWEEHKAAEAAEAARAEQAAFEAFRKGQRAPNTKAFTVPAGVPDHMMHLYAQTIGAAPRPAPQTQEFVEAPAQDQSADSSMWR